MKKKEILESFELKSLKLIKGGGLALDYSVSSVEESDTYTDTMLKKSPRTPHPDLENLVLGLNKYVASVHGMSVSSVLKKMAPTATAKLQDSINTVIPSVKQIEDELLNNIEVTGISLSGSETNRGVVITAVNRNNKEGMALNTCRIQFARDKWGWEFELDEKIDKILHEVKAYLFDGKHGIPVQTEMEFEDADGEEGKDAIAV